MSITHPITHPLPLHTLGVLHTPFLHYTLCNTPLVGVYLIIHVNVCNTCVLQSGYLSCVAEVVAGRRRKQAKRTSEEQRVVTSVDGILVTTLGVVISDGKDSEDSSNTTRGTVDDEEGDMRRRGARECEEALMEATEARRGYARVAAWDEGNLIQAMARLKNPTIAWRYGDG